MTRYARSGSTQKHKKMPGDATPWSQFSSNRQKNLPSNELNNKDNIKNSGDPQNKMNFKRYFSGTNTDLVNAEEEGKSVKHTVSSKIIKREITFSEEDSIKDIFVAENSEIEKKPILNETVPNKKNKKRKRSKNKNKITNQVSKNEAEQSETAKSPKKLSQSQVSEDRKKFFLEKLKKKRAQNGITLLPSKVERKLYNIRRKLRDKVPAAVLKEILRKERRKEELKFRKTFDPSKPCFNCRKPGHFLADCPEKAKSSNQVTGICFKCGSSSHTSIKCTDKVQGFPFAKCFICKEQGHISKDCPNNMHGVYIKGGRCNLCGNVNHLKKDCSSLKKKKIREEEESFTLPTINEATSIDEEIIERKNVFKRNNEKKHKIVKF